MYMRSLKQKLYHQLLYVVSEIARVSIYIFYRTMFPKQRKICVLAERPSTSPTTSTSTPPAPANRQTPADNGKLFCLETSPLPIFTNIHTIFYTHNFDLQSVTETTTTVVMLVYPRNN